LLNQQEVFCLSLGNLILKLIVLKSLQN